METVRSLFFDTYAFFELFEGKENYKPYAKGVAIVTTRLNLMELHYGLLLKKGKEVADMYYLALVRFAIEVDDETIIKANEWRALMKGKDLSYVDCIGYTLAKSRNIPFLTGDGAFMGLENVEYVR